MHKTKFSLLFPGIRDFGDIFDEIKIFDRRGEPCADGHFYCSGLPGDLISPLPGIFQRTSVRPKEFVLASVLERIVAGQPSFSVEADHWYCRDPDLNPEGLVLVAASQMFAMGTPFISLISPSTIPGYHSHCERSLRVALECDLRYDSAIQKARELPSEKQAEFIGQAIDGIVSQMIQGKDFQYFLDEKTGKTVRSKLPVLDVGIACLYYDEKVRSQLIETAIAIDIPG